MDLHIILMSITKRLKACYLRWAKKPNSPTGMSETDICLSIKIDAFIKELQAAQELGLSDTNGWLDCLIVENAAPEGGGKYSHKLIIRG